MLSVTAMTSEGTARFQREAKMACQLNHPNIVTVLDFGVTERAKPYMVMEYVEGKALDTLIAERGSLTVEEGYPLFLQICEGVAHAHKRGVLHRDLKPNNVMLTNSQSDTTVVKILDFGLAKMQGVAGETLTQVGAVIGSPHYMSPEQAQGKELDQRSDIYSLGVLIYEMLTGSVPVSGDSAMETLRLKSLNPAPRLDNGRFPLRLCELVDRCLKIDPAERFQSVDDLEAALIAVVEEWEQSEHRSKKADRAWKVNAL